ncbi:PTS cellobiose transporter subunit IIC [Tissierella sp. MSJ-40]|uniref:Permease IIC component n=1 Tax=Tissierella simiarum TaxID=2841534 RepID=A0ABS6E1X8_9FIRM|nr:PTS cellobiose transporter subunit IIC [Tissierella simiarum]MBU5436910.1 PTS cellobiose transporter subunit IIC [Tissierella simiarum]
MQRFMDSLEKLLMPLAEKIGKNKYLIAIRDGFLISSPLLIIGSFFLLVANFPIPGWNDFLAKFFGEGWATKLMQPVRATFDVMTILAVLGIGYSLGRQLDVDAIASSAIALVAFFILTPFITNFTPNDMEVVYEVKSIPLKWVGSNGLFVGMITALTSVLLFAKIVKKGWIIKMPEGVPPTVAKSFAALIPSGIVMVVFFIVKTLFEFTSYGNVHEIIYTYLQAPLTSLGNTLPAMVIAYIFLHLFWFFGINGSSVVGAVYNPILRVLSAENLAAFQAGLPIPNIITGTFQDMFATFGGAGSTLSLIVAMLYICKSKRIKELGKLSLLPGIFGINEPIIFGLPIMLNPIMLIPFMLVPTINIIIAYFAMSLGIVPLTNGVSVPWTTPLVFSGFLVSGIRGAILQIILFIIGVFIYIPFIKIVDRQYLKEEDRLQSEDSGDISFDSLDF